MSVSFHHTTLDNGLQVVAEVNPHVYSVAVSFVVRTGARDERPEEYGLAHFLEHMAFKGTERRSAEDINREFDEIGAHYNAATSEELTSFYAVVLPEFLARAVDLLADILQPALRPEDFELEKQVILEEIRMYQDQPTWTLYDRAIETYFAGHDLGHSVLGTTATVSSLTVEQMRAYHAERYRAGNIVVFATGNFDWPELLQLLAQHCGHWPGGRPRRKLTGHAPQPLVRVFRDDKVEHAYLVGMSPAPRAGDPQALAASSLAAAIGDSTGSRLFWELIDPGRADSADYERHAFTDTGAYMAYLSCAPERLQENVETLLRVCREVEENGIEEEELDRVRKKFSSQLVRSAERPMGRLHQIASDWLYRGLYQPVDAALEEYDRIALEHVRMLLPHYRLVPAAFIGLGPIDETALQQQLAGYRTATAPAG